MAGLGHDWVVKVTGLRFLLAVVALIAIALGVVVVVRRDPYRPGTFHEVTVRMGSGPNPCANPAALFLDGRAWDAEDLAPSSWGADSAHPGRLDVVDVDQGVFSAVDDPGITIRFRRRAQFSYLGCAIR